MVEPYVLSDAPGTLARDELERLDAYWRAANYLSVGQIYLLSNPLLGEGLTPEQVKPRLLGHWGTTPGLNLVYAHANRAILARDLDAVYVMGPGHGGPGPNACAWLEGTYSETYSDITRDTRGMAALFRQFSYPGGVPSHVAPDTPGSFHEGGELGYALLHAYGAAMDNPDLTVFCVVGDGEAETSVLAGSWPVIRFLDPARDGTVVPILHLNGYKIANPTMLDRIPEEDLLSLLRGHGWAPVVVAGDDPAAVHQAMAAAMDGVLDDAAELKRQASDGEDTQDAHRPMIILRTPKGWTGPKVVDGQPVEGTFRSHQVPLPSTRANREHLTALESWLRSYRPEELFDEQGVPVPDVLSLNPAGARRMSANPVSNGGVLLRDLRLPDWRAHAVDVPSPGVGAHEPTRAAGGYLRDVIDANPDSFLLMGPDEVASNRLQDAFEVTGRRWRERTVETDVALDRDGRVIEYLSENVLQGLLEGYLLTGRHGLLTSYEAFIHVVDAMFNQHAKWLDATRKISWRAPIASLTYLLSSHVWRQDHNGNTHQDPGFLDVVLNKKPEIVRIYLPPDANTLLSTVDHCLRSRHYVNVITAGKQPCLDLFDADQADLHCIRGLGVLEWASTDDGLGDPDVVLGCAGDVPTLETLAAADILRAELPDLRVRVVNVVDLMRLQPEREHPHGMSDRDFDALFTRDRPIVFAFHGYPWLVHRLTYRRRNHDNLHVRGYKEEGTTTTPFDMVMMNELDRFHLVMDVIDRVPSLGSRAGRLRQRMADERLRARRFTRTDGEDLPEVSGWTWGHYSGAGR